MNNSYLFISIKREKRFYQSKYTQFKLKSKDNIIRAYLKEVVRDLQVTEIIRWESDLVKKLT